jgi:hypothetical protein
VIVAASDHLARARTVPAGHGVFKYPDMLRTVLVHVRPGAGGLDELLAGLAPLFGFTSTGWYEPSGSNSSTGSVRPAFTPPQQGRARCPRRRTSLPS